MTPAQLARLFEPFSQGDASMSPLRGDRARARLSRHVANLMGGEIAVHSQAGQGSVFTIELPAQNHLGNCRSNRAHHNDEHPAGRNTGGRRRRPLAI